MDIFWKKCFDPEKFPFTLVVTFLVTMCAEKRNKLFSVYRYIIHNIGIALQVFGLWSSSDNKHKICCWFNERKVIL